MYVMQLKMVTMKLQHMVTDGSLPKCKKNN